jgi:hypothetical protein
MYKGVRCTLEERTDPMDGEKEIFFCNLLSSTTNVFQVMQVMYHGDMRPVFPVHFNWLEKVFVAIVWGFFALIFGYRLKYRDLKRD